MPASGQHEQRSLFGEILDWMLAPLLLLWPMSLGLTWVVAQAIAANPYDRELADVVRALARQASAQASDASAASVRSELERSAALLRRDEDDDRSYYQVLGRRGELLAGEAGLAVPGEDAAGEPGVRFRDDLIGDEPVRVAYLWLPPPPGGGRSDALVQVAETLGKRSHLATEIIKGVILPQFVILPLAVVLVWFALARGIRPAGRTAAAHPQAREHRPVGHRRRRRARRSGAAGARDQRPAAAAGTTPSPRSAISWPTPRIS